MAKTTDQIYAERKQKIEERRKYLTENRELYRRDFDEAFKKYLMTEGLDPKDDENKFDPQYRKDFTDSLEGRELAVKYSLQQAWDPDDDVPPSPAIVSSVRVIRCQDDRIWSNQIREDSIINLPPYEVFGRFLIAEIDLSYPRREIKTDIMDYVDQKTKKLKINGRHRELVDRPEPRDRDSSFSFEKMEVWKMVEKERQTQDEEEKIILWRIATDKTSEAKTDSFDGKEWNREVRRFYDALSNAYDRDKKMYYGN